MTTTTARSVQRIPAWLPAWRDLPKWKELHANGMAIKNNRSFTNRLATLTSALDVTAAAVSKPCC